MYNILICDDEKDIVNALKIYLTNPDYTLFEAYDGLEALEILKDNQIDLILLDIMMPSLDGLSTLSRIRESNNKIPIILLTAKSEDDDIILGLNIGADDYITKPFNPLEVLARVNSQIRRYYDFKTHEYLNNIIQIGGVELNKTTKEIWVDGQLVNLTPKEFEILRLLMSNAGQLFSPTEVYRQVWLEEPLSGNDNIVAVHVRHLREKIEIDPSNPRYIKVIFGQGYKFAKEVLR